MERTAHHGFAPTISRFFVDRTLVHQLTCRLCQPTQRTADKRPSYRPAKAMHTTTVLGCRGPMFRASRPRPRGLAPGPAARHPQADAAAGGGGA